MYRLCCFGLVLPKALLQSSVSGDSFYKLKTPAYNADIAFDDTALDCSACLITSEVAP
jgi:hypothetical protein